jgi:hypothetical protein
MIVVLSEQLFLDAVVIVLLLLLLLLLEGSLSFRIGLGKGASTLIIRRLVVGSCKLVSDDDDDDDEVSSTTLTIRVVRSKVVSADEDNAALSGLPLRVGSRKVVSKAVLLLSTLSRRIGSCEERSELSMDGVLISLSRREHARTASMDDMLSALVRRVGTLGARPPPNSCGESTSS